MWSPWRPILHKIGVSNRPDLREKQVGAICLFHVRLPWAYSIEAALHRYMRPLNVRLWGDGKTEWFLTANPIFALIAYNAHLWYGILPSIPTWAFIAVFIAPLPIDSVLILLTIAAVSYAGIAAVIGLSVYALTFLFA
jgi:hypothetical protein